METIKLIQPVPVVRDESGYWYHPDIPDFDEDHEAWKAWLDAQGLKVVGWHMDSDLETHPYWEDGEAHCMGWEPEAPAEAGWFLLGIFDTDDGPYVQWARRETKPKAVPPNKEFEAAYKDACLKRSVPRFDPAVFATDHCDCYVIPAVQSAWWAWHASRAALVITLPQAPAVPEDPEEAIDDSHMDAYHSAVRMRNACAQAIEAAGLKVNS